MSDDESSSTPPEGPGVPSVLPARLVDALPPTLPVLVSSVGPLYPGMMTPVPIMGDREEETLKQATGFVGVVAARPEADGEDMPLSPRFMYEVGVAGRVMQQTDLPDGRPAVVVMATRRMRVTRFLRHDRVLLAEVQYPDDVVREQREVDAMFRRLQQSFMELVRTSPEIPEEVEQLVQQVEDPGRLADFIAANLGKEISAKQAILASFEVDSRLRTALLMVEQELDLAKLGEKIRDEIRTNIEARQKEHFLREQMKAIRKELGEEVDQREMDRDEYRGKIDAANMPEEAEARALQELDRLALLPTEASEYHVIRNYLDWLVELPWSKRTEELLDVAEAARVLDADHHGLDEVKDRIVEFLAVRKLAPEQKGAILCLVGPPGVGKTSLGQSVARAMGREFHRVSLGGMRDEAEIKGHRRTYVGAMPGKILQGMRRVGVRNPVFMLDEIDKLGSSWRGDPSSAMLEVLDPAQNHAFEDLYIDLPFDLTDVMFIATGNVPSNIPAPLRDRMEVISLSGYIPEEKQAIARRFLLPRQMKSHGLTGKTLQVHARALGAMVDGYTREAGVRQLERVIGRVCRKVAARVAALPEGKPSQKTVVTQKSLPEYLGPRRFFKELARRTRQPGVVVGLAYTAVGGEILFIEATSMPGRGQLVLTGKIGDVMSESVRIAHTIIRSRAEEFQIPRESLKQRDFHLHVPAGAVPKDGPSAGVAMVCALLSLLWRGKGKAARARVAVTGEITLRGLVMPVGGIKEKVVGAKRAGIKTVVLPARNEPDVGEIPEAVRKGLEFIYVERIEQAVEAVIGSLPGVKPKKKSVPRKKRKPIITT